MNLTILKTRTRHLARYLFFLLVVSPSTSVWGQDQEILQVQTNPKISYQTIDGFGASDAWRAQFVGKNWPIAKRDQIADLLFSQKDDEAGNPVGIGLSIWRFYLSSGTAEQGRSSGIRNPWRRGECFLNADGSYDWSKQAGQQWFLRAAKERGVEKLLVFPNAPPVYLSANGKGYATKGDIHFNLKPGYIDKYATYLVDVIDHFGKAGICFDYLSPVNEPQWNWDDRGQEGTPALNEEIYALVESLSQALAARGLNTQIVISEAGTIGHLSKIKNATGEESDGRDDQAHFFFSKDSPFYVGKLPNVANAISAHSYFSVWPIDEQVNNRIKVASLLKQIDPDLGYWMSEYCILQENDEIRRGSGRDLTMKTALYVARIIHNDLTLCNAQSWQWWTAITECDYKDGLVYLDDGSNGDTGRMGGNVASLQTDGVVRESKLLWVLGNYSRFVRPGMIRIECSLSEEQSVKDGLLVSAYADADAETGRVVYVFTNLSEQEQRIQIGPAKQVKTYTTDEQTNLGLKVQSLDHISIPARSVVTIVN